jgi:2',3'-cyclic-nucleotide 2'-phosphodiesterase (5'-nucleotidase family)
MYKKFLIMIRRKILFSSIAFDLSHSYRLATFLRSLGPPTNNVKINDDHPYDKTITPSAVTLVGDFVAASTLSSVDGGRGHIASFRACGVTHASLGNHEADPPLDVLRLRLNELTAKGNGLEGDGGKAVILLNSNVKDLGIVQSKAYDVIASTCGRIKLGLIGLLSDEPNMFPKGTFRGLQIDKVKETYGRMLDDVDADLVVPMTHQSLNADIELARSMMLQSKGMGVILGGHEHVKIHEHISPDDGCDKNVVEIIKTGQNSDRAAVVDLRFDPITHKLVDSNVHFEELDERHSPCPIVEKVVNTHLAVLDRMSNYIVFNTRTMLANYFHDKSSDKIGRLPLSSEFTRYEQTTVGAFLCTAVKSELGVDACVINGAPIKGSKTYVDGTMSYEELRTELPFPLKIVVVEMTRRRLREAVEYSRTNVEKGKSSTPLEDGRVERRGYLQTDFDYWDSCDDNDNDEDEIITVALPRNLLNGFCKIKPLMDLRDELESNNSLPNEDNYVKAIDLIARYCLDDRWAIIAQRLSFADLDLNHDGKLSREEIRKAIRHVLREEASDALLDAMIDAIDLDHNGSINEEEFNHLLSKIRSQTWEI